MFCVDTDWQQLSVVLDRAFSWPYLEMNVGIESGTFSLQSKGCTSELKLNIDFLQLVWDAFWSFKFGF